MELADRGNRTRTDLWNERTVGWYERANATSDYAAKVLEAVADILDGSHSALDVGAGFGALAVPLARRLARVTAIEPSPAMANALRRSAERHGLANLRVREVAWGAVPVDRHDLVVCAHVSHLLEPGSRFLSEANELADRGVVLVRDLPGVQDKFFFGELYPILLGRPYVHGCDARDTLGDLERLGIVAAQMPIEYDSDQPFDSIEEACDFWLEYMRPTRGDARAFLRSFLGERLTRRGDGWVAPFRKRAMVIHWSSGPDRDASRSRVRARIAPTTGWGS